MPKKKTPGAEIARTARENLNYDSLRPGQEEAISSLVAKRDTLVVQPTGSGKSAIYQIAGLLIEGTTVVVSPLIALQKDQVDTITAQNTPAAAALNSTQPVSEARETLEQMQAGEIEYFFLAPEQLRKPETMRRTVSANGATISAPTTFASAASSKRSTIR